MWETALLCVWVMGQAWVELAVDWRRNRRYSVRVQAQNEKFFVQVQ